MSQEISRKHELRLMGCPVDKSTSEILNAEQRTARRGGGSHEVGFFQK